MWCWTFGEKQGLREGVQEVHRTQARQDESTYAKFSCNMSKNKIDGCFLQLQRS